MLIEKAQLTLFNTADIRYVKCLYFSLIFIQVNTAWVFHLSFTASCSWWGLRLEISSMNMSQWGRNWSRQWMSWQERWNSSMSHLPSQFYSEISYKKTKLLYIPWRFWFYHLSLFIFLPETWLLRTSFLQRRRIRS